MDLEPAVKQPKVVQSQYFGNTGLKPLCEQIASVMSYHQVGLSTFHQSACALLSSLNKSISKPVVCTSESPVVQSPVLPGGNSLSQSANVTSFA